MHSCLCVWSYWTLPFVSSIRVCVCVCVCVCVFSLFPSLSPWPQGVKGFIVFRLATGSAGPSKLSFVPSENSPLNNFSNHWLPLAAALIGIWVHPSQRLQALTLNGCLPQFTHHMDAKTRVGGTQVCHSSNVGVRERGGGGAGRKRENLQELILSFHHVGPGDRLA